MNADPIHLQAVKAKDALRAIEHNIRKLRQLCLKDSVFDDPTEEIESVSGAVREATSPLANTPTKPASPTQTAADSTPG